MAITGKNWRDIAKGTTLASGLALIGILPALGISLLTPIFGALNVGMLFGGLNLATFYALQTRKL